MTAYEQAVNERNTAQAELERVENEIQQTQQEYESFNTTPMDTAAPHQTNEQERNRLATRLTTLIQDRARWLNSRTHAEHAMQRELERLVHELHGEVVHQEHEREQATTSEDAQEATHHRDQAQSQLDQREHELATMRKQEEDKG